MPKRLVRLFVTSAAVLLLATALAKAVSAVGDAVILQGPDPIFGIALRTLLVVTAAIEGVVAWVCLRASRFTLKVELLLWLSIVFVLYRLGLWVVGYDQPCHCLGTMTDALHISPGSADVGMRIVLLYLLIGSGAARLWLRGQSETGSDEQVAKPVNVLQ